MDFEMIGGTHELLPNDVLQELMHKSLSQVGGFDYTTKENEFAKRIAETLGKPLNMAFVNGLNLMIRMRFQWDRLMWVM